MYLSFSGDCFLKKLILIVFFKDFIYLFLESSREGEREEEKHQCEVVFCTPLPGDPAWNPGVCPVWELSWQLFGLQAGTQSTELHNPGLYYIFYITF